MKSTKIRILSIEKKNYSGIVYFWSQTVKDIYTVREVSETHSIDVPDINTIMCGTSAFFRIHYHFLSRFQEINIPINVAFALVVK